MSSSVPGRNDALVAALEALARALGDEAPAPQSPAPAPALVSLPWNALVWRADLVPDATLLTIEQAAEATGWTRAAIYKRTSRWHREHDTCAPLPHLRVAGSLRIRVGELRQWLRGHEQVIVPGPTEPLVVTQRRRLTTELTTEGAA